MRLLVTVFVLVVIVAGGWYLMRGNATSPVPHAADLNVFATSTDRQITEQTSSSTAPLSAMVIYGPTGFSPSTVTIAEGGTVTFENESGGQMWVASNPHPTHEGYSGTTRAEHCPDTAGTAFDECMVADTYTFTFEKVGSWGYHNHLNHSDTGTIIVE